MRRKEKSDRNRETRKKWDDCSLLARLSNMFGLNKGTQKAYRVCAKFARDINGAQIMPSEAKLTEMSNALSQAAKDDLRIESTPNGYAANLRDLVELTLHMHESSPLPVCREPTANRLTFPEPKISMERGVSSRMADENKFIKFTFDARNDQAIPRVVTTAGGISLMMSGDVGGILSGMVLRIKTNVILEGKDSAENVRIDLGQSVLKRF